MYVNTGQNRDLFLFMILILAERLVCRRFGRIVRPLGRSNAQQFAPEIRRRFVLCMSIANRDCSKYRFFSSHPDLDWFHPARHQSLQAHPTDAAAKNGSELPSPLPTGLQDSHRDPAPQEIAVSHHQWRIWYGDSMVRIIVTHC